MKMHPAEISSEIKQFSFFKDLADDVILQLSTMMENIVVPAGSYLVRESEKNNRLFFLRKGHIDLMIADEVLTSYFTPGEVLGEMSVISGKPSTIDLRAAKDTDLFVIDTNNFNLILPKNRDAFFSYIYRLYAMILCDRLEKTAEKARFFEVAHRELHEAQLSLGKVKGSKALLIQTDKRQLVLTKMGVGGAGLRMDVAGSSDEGISKALADKYDVIICDEATLDVVQKLKAEKYNAQFILLLTKNIQDNLTILHGLSDVDFVVTKDPDDRQRTVRTVLTALTKILNHDYFGMEKYLAWGAEVQSQMIKGSSGRVEMRDEMVGYLKNSGVRTSIADRCNTVVEEMLMNAVYDAPTDQHGTPLYNHLSRKQPIILDTHMQSNLKYATDGNMIGISVTDPFGSLTKDTIIKYLQSCYQGNAGVFNQNKGGAGRGLHQIIENADVTIFNVKRGTKTEVISLFSLETTRRGAYPSFHYFFEE